MSKWGALREILSQRRKDAKVKADDNLFLTGLGIEAEHFSTLQQCNPVQNKTMPFAPLRLCEKILNPVNPVNPVKKISSGFTLVETALALLAIGLGLIALFGLGRLAMESSREAENDRRCAMMADAIFETLRAVNAIYINEARTIGQYVSVGGDDPADGDPSSSLVLNHWNRLWNQEAQLRGDPPLPLWDSNGRLLFPPVGGMRSMVTNDVPLIKIVDDFIQPSPGDDLYTIQDVGLVRAYNKDVISLASWNPLYRLEINNVNDYRYYSPAAGNTTAKQVLLYIYPDGLTASSNPRIFTTTLSNTGGMP